MPCSQRTDPWRHMDAAEMMFSICSNISCFSICNVISLYGRGQTILTSRELMWCYACSWDWQRRCNIEFCGADSHTSATLLTSRDLGSRASTPLKFLLSHTFRETWRTCRNGGNANWKSTPTDLFMWHQVTRLYRAAYESQRMGRDREGVENKTLSFMWAHVT